ncbi:MAG: hypothetical protein K0U98_07485 [Deltaproteobacteria bacterium]|nr:hypothetical protein [Deltaproteobacteria bacterium]
MTDKLCLFHRPISLLSLFLVLSFATGCGYSLVGRASNLPEDIRTVYVGSLENRTARSQVEQVLTRAIVDELVTRQRFEVVSTAAGADAELRGAVVAYGATPVAFDADGRATEYEIGFVTEVIFQRLPRTPDEEPEVIWQNDRYQFREPYEVLSEGVDYFDQEDQAIVEVAERFAETMVSDLLEGF